MYSHSNNLIELRNLFKDIDFESDDIKPKVNNQTKYNFAPIKECSNCKNKDNIIEDTDQGTIVCTNCGQVLENIFDSCAEWRNYDDDKGDKIRCSVVTNQLLPQSSLGTTISGGAWKSRLKIIHNWSAMPYKERSLNTVFKEIQSKCAQYKILKCIEDDAKIMYKNISESKHIDGRTMIIRGDNRKSLIAACVFFACKRKGMTRSPKEIADLFNIKYTCMTKGCKNLQKVIDMKLIEVNTGTSKPEDFVSRFCKELKLKQQFIDQTIKIAKNIKKLNVASVHTPYSIAIASLIIMLEANNMENEQFNRKSLCQKFGVSEITIIKTLKKISEYKDIIISDTKTEKKLTEQNNNNQDISEELIRRCLKLKLDTSCIFDSDEQKLLYYQKYNIKA